MRAVLLCAGQGTRLRPLTYCRPKHLVPVAGRAVLDRVLSSLADAGVDEAIFVVSPGETELQKYVDDGARWGMDAAFCVQTEPRGLAHALACARGFIRPDERFLMYLGDDLLGEGITKFAQDFAASGAAASLVVKPVEDPRAFGVVVVEDGVVTHLIEKPEDPPSDLAVVGVYGFGPQIWDAIDAIEPSARGELEITDAIDHLASSGHRVDYHVTEGFWADAGSPEAILAANRFFLDASDHRIEGDVDEGSSVAGDVTVGAGARIVGSEITGPCIIGADCVIESSKVGPNVSLGDGCTVRGAEIADSVIDGGTRIEDAGAKLTGSIIGRDATVRGLASANGVPLSLLLADDSMIAPSNGE